MKLLGDWNWYLPSWLEWLPKIGIGEPGGPYRTYPNSLRYVRAACAGVPLSMSTRH